MQVAGTWTKRTSFLTVNAFGDDYEAHFICGILQFISAYEHENSSIAAETIIEATTHLNKCTEICTQIQTTKSYKHIRFYFGKGKDLGRIIPRHVFENEPRDLEIFEGRQIGKNTCTVRVKNFTEHRIKARLQNPKTGRYAAEQQRMLKFNLAFAHDTIYACNACV